MQFQVKTGQPEKQRTACLVAGVFEKRHLSETARMLDQVADGTISRMLKSGDIKGKVGETLLLHNLGGTAIDRVLLVGCGEKGTKQPAEYRKIVAAAAEALQKMAAKDAVYTLNELEVADRNLTWKVRQSVEAVGAGLYRFDQTKSEQDPESTPALRKLAILVVGKGDRIDAQQGVDQGRALVAGRRMAQDLANLPGNLCTPTYLAEEANRLAHDHKRIKTTILDQKAMEKLKMGALLSVAKGSRQPPKLIVMEYEGEGGAKSGAAKGAKRKQKPVVLVGKGLTFDAGGISLKPAANMDEMKYDMCGGASVIGTMKAVAELGLPINVVGVVPSCENLPDGAANKPGDIVTSMSGQTIEILNTDAEGRLILCDALTYSKRFKPEVVIDVATLTGACVIALGKHPSGLLGNDQSLVDSLLAAGEQSGDRAWQLPLWEEYQEQLKSNFADMANIGGREAGTITAACFLSRFTKEYKWAHLDIAGTAWTGGEKKGATGRPVGLLMQYLIDRSGK